MTTDPPTLTIRAETCQTCHGDGQAPPITAGALQSFTPCPTCHARGPEPGWVWPEDVTLPLHGLTVVTDPSDECVCRCLNALYAAQKDQP